MNRRRLSREVPRHRSPVPPTITRRPHSISALTCLLHMWSVEQMSFGLAGIVLEEGELKLVQNAEAGTFVGGSVTEDGALELEFES